MKIGFSKINITPPLGTQMCGQLFEYRAKGVESNLYATAMYLDDGDSQVAFVSCDVLVISNETAKEIRSATEKTSQISADNIILCVTHTHSGPMTQDLFGMDANSEYVVQMKTNIVEAVKQARDNAFDGQMHIAKDQFPGYAFNRRFIMSDDTIETHPLKNDPHIVRAEGPDSKDLTVFYAADSKGKSLGAVIVFGCHATVMHRDNDLISSDFCGKLVEFVSDKLGGVPVLFLQAASGNICATNPLDTSKTEVGLEWAKTMGTGIGQKAIELIEDKLSAATGAIHVLTKTINLPRRAIDPELVEWANKHKYKETRLPVLSDYGTEHYGKLERPKVSLAELFKTPFWANFYANEIKTLEKYRQDEPNMPFTIKVITADNWAIVSLPCELFIEWSNLICEKSPFEFTTVVELANGFNGYIPTREAFRRKGGYETKEVSSTMLIPEAGDLMAGAVLEMLSEMKQ